MYEDLYLILNNTTMFFSWNTCRVRSSPFEIYQMFLYQAVWLACGQSLSAISLWLWSEPVKDTKKDWKYIEGAMKYRASFQIIYFIRFGHHVLIDDEKIMTFFWDKISPCPQVKNTQLNGQPMITICWLKNCLVK